jgi:AraC-like DNA-binding protein
MMINSIPFQHNQYLNSPDIDAVQEFLNTLVDNREIIPLSCNKKGMNTINMQALGKTFAFSNNWKDKVRITSDPLSTCHLVIPIKHSVEDKVTKSRINAGDVLISVPGNSVDLIYDKGCSALVTTFDIHTLKDYFQIDTCSLMNHETQIIPATELTSQSLRSLFTCISQQHQINQGEINPQMQKHFESMLMDSISDHILTHDIRILPVHVKIAVDWIISDLHRPFDITKLTALCGCSRRSLENGFKQYIGISPAKYVVGQKLHAINKRLKSSSSESVGELAFQFGFNNPSHFTNLYKNTFGETPSETMSNRISIHINIPDRIRQNILINPRSA